MQQQKSPEPQSLLQRKDVLGTLIAIGFIFIAIGQARSPNGDDLHELAENIGLILIILSIFGRTWCAIYLGGREGRELVTRGPYSVCRHPMYSFAILGGVGVGAQVGSFVIGLVCGFIAWLILQRFATREETALQAEFGSLYQQYAKRVPRFIPKLSLWEDVDVVEVWPRTVMLAFLDAAVFLIAIPIAEAVEYLHDVGALPAIFHLP
ncbi:MAG TPA: isoprenylcysteine carboxylmethyltransferase family protein [Pseudolabrys sp.]|jgi:protein-S-isoprenylcysteine O-methyltransferase Ste14